MKMRNEIMPSQEELLNYILTTLDYEDITEEQKETIKKELDGMTIYDDEKLVVETSGMSSESGKLIYDVVLRNDSNVDRHICYI